MRSVAASGASLWLGSRPTPAEGSAAASSLRPRMAASRPRLVALPLDRPLPPQVGSAARARQICALAEREARRVGMSPHFFARLLHRESRFDPEARSHVGALGVAQFMPATAGEMGLNDPTDPTRAIPAAADYLARLRAGFGNWGLAAAAYNGGPARVRAWLEKRGGLPGETVRYVRGVTGEPVTKFRTPEARVKVRPLTDDTPFVEACVALPRGGTSAKPIEVASVPRGLTAAFAPSTDTAPAMPLGIVLAADGTAPIIVAEAEGLSTTLAPSLTPALAASATEVASEKPVPDELVRNGADVAAPVPMGLTTGAIRVTAVAQNTLETTGNATVPGIATQVAALPLGQLPQIGGPPVSTFVGPPHPLDRPLAKPTPKALRVEQICHLIHREALRVGMPPSFFARLINKESRFDIYAVSPVGAEGVAQFMPYTARERGLKDPFDPLQAIPASADYLWDLRNELGTWPLAAAGYNAGPGRVRDFFAGRRLPPETRDYVASIALRPATDFRDRVTKLAVTPLDPTKPFMEACRLLPTKRFSKPKIARDEEPWQPWGVQLSASFKRASAVASFERQVKRYDAVLKGRRPLVIATPVRGSKRKKYAARLGAPNRAAAEKLCASIKRAGGACVVFKNKN